MSYRNLEKNMPTKQSHKSHTFGVQRIFVHVGDMSKMKLTGHKYKILNLIKTSPTITVSNMSERPS